MKQTLDSNSFIEAFRAYDRYDQFGYKALQILFDYLEQCEEDCGQEIELDVIALCCDYSVDAPEDIAKEYSIDLDPEESTLNQVVEWLNDNTSVCGVTDDGIIVYCTAF